MRDFIYHRVLPISREDAEAAFASQESTAITHAILSLAYHDPDWKWVQDKCLEFIYSPVPNARYISILCFGHLARIHGILELDKVLPVLESLKDDPELGGIAEDVIEEVQWFISRKNRKKRKK